MSNKKLLTYLTFAVGVFAAVTAISYNAGASTTKVGNGDDGSDLEGGQKVESGILIETRNKAVDRLKNLSVQNIAHLGTLLPELEKTEIYLVPRDLKAELKGDHGLEASADGQSVYARTFAEPHAATRFFPAALMLNEQQLISLHVHEALHRSLPVSVRENEDVVSRITLALTSPDSSLDRVKRTVARNIPDENEGEDIVSRAGQIGTSIISEIADDKTPLENPSSVTYRYRSFFRPESQRDSYPIDSLHSLQSLLYPFGSGSKAFGVGLEFSYIKTPDHAFVGPVSISARVRLTSVRGFDVGAFATLAMNTTSADELRNSPLGRDVRTLGVTLLRQAPNYYVENSLSVSGEGEATQKLGMIDYTHRYGTMTALSVRAGVRRYGFEIGGQAEALISESYRVTGGGFDENFGRSHIISVGPEIAYNTDPLRFALGGSWVLDSTSGVNFADFGDLLGHGVGKGSINASMALRF